VTWSYGSRPRVGWQGAPDTSAEGLPLLWEVSSSSKAAEGILLMLPRGAWFLEQHRARDNRVLNPQFSSVFSRPSLESIPQGQRKEEEGERSWTGGNGASARARFRAATRAWAPAATQSPTGSSLLGAFGLLPGDAAGFLGGVVAGTLSSRRFNALVSNYRRCW